MRLADDGERGDVNPSVSFDQRRAIKAFGPALQPPRTRNSADVAAC
ncbi:hypothetical protein KCP73_14405 [Salmonella enterica subsp. enterica]|nr:hypothetical protein KCP73_14405 [Salmonella enterica subsp. enterica]